MNNVCPHCILVEQCEAGTYSLLIHTFPHSYLVLGTHQYFKGYSQLITKKHIRDIHLESPEFQQAIFKELMLSMKAIETHFSPWKMNFSFYGNQVQHAHFHLFPRYQTENDHLKVPWFYMDEFNSVPTDNKASLSVIKALSLLIKSF